jgi:serine/threonine protein kinase
MNPDNQSIGRIKEILSRAKNLSSGKNRDAFLDQACGGDAALRSEVESLLRANDSAGDFLSRDASGEALLDFPDLLGTMIDHYRLVERIGEGGFGEIYRAEQIKPFHRVVAIKIIKLGMDSKGVIARFEAERQALALMNHPGIAQVYDAGTTESGRPYFVMEMVEGIPIIEYCDRHRLSLPNRIRLFQQVCDAVEHAHCRGILHRDLKPSNILVREENGKPLAKIIDFGVAKSLEGRLTEQVLDTLQEMLIGTPMYMSPEQLNEADGDLDARADIYSMGIILYELLAGTTPIQNRAPNPLTMAGMRQVLNTFDPPRPSKLLRSMGRKTLVISDRRQVKPPTLERQLRGDLDWVVMKAIEKDRQLRYGNVESLEKDLQHYLDHEPVSAKAPNLPYRARKFIRRHKTTRFVFSTVIIMALLSGGIMTYSFIQLTKKPQTLIEERGWKLEKIYESTDLGINRVAPRPDGTLLFTSGWTECNRHGLFVVRKKGDQTEKVLAEGPMFTCPIGVVELPEGIYVAVNNPHEKETKILNISSDGKSITTLCDAPILNPFGMTVAPETFDGTNVVPGDLLVFDNGLGYVSRIAIWAVSRETGAVRPLIKGNVLGMGKGFLNGSIGPDGMLYAGLNDRYPYRGATIMRISPEGEVEAVLDKFYFSEVLNDQHATDVAVHPRTGEIFFSCRNNIFAFFPGKTQPCLVLPKGRNLLWSSDGSKLYITEPNRIWVLSGPGIDTDPISTETAEKE